MLLKVETENRETIGAGGEIRTQRVALKGGVTVDYAQQTTVLSLTALRRLRFPIQEHKAETDGYARTVLAALALVAITVCRERGYWLRSRCGLVPDGLQSFEIVKHDGTTSPLDIDRAMALRIYRDAVQAAREAGLPWQATPIELQPQGKLIELVRKSRELRQLAG